MSIRKIFIDNIKKHWLIKLDNNQENTVKCLKNNYQGLDIIQNMLLKDLNQTQMIKAILILFIKVPVNVIDVFLKQNLIQKIQLSSK
jgi:hypothetical protein